MASALDLIVAVLQQRVSNAAARTTPRTAASNNAHRAQRKITRSFIQSGFNEVRIRARGGTQPRTSQKPHDSVCLPDGGRQACRERFLSIFGFVFWELCQQARRIARLRIVLA